MAFTIYLCGHGGWQPDDGFITVPKGCRVIFYGHFAKTVLAGDTETLVAGEFDGEPHAISEQFRTCPNMTLSPTSEDIMEGKAQAFARNPAKDSSKLYFTPEVTNLGRLFADDLGFMDDARAMIDQHGSVDFVWSCCRSVKLPGYHRAMSDEIGWNAIDRFVPGHFQFRYKTRGKKGPGTDVKKVGGELRVRGQAVDDPWFKQKGYR